MTQPSTYQLHVSGMSCQHCVKAITRAIHTEDPQAHVNVDLETGRVDVQSVLAEATIRSLIHEEGYEIAS